MRALTSIALRLVRRLQGLLDQFGNLIAQYLGEDEAHPQSRANQGFGGTAGIDNGAGEGQTQYAVDYPVFSQEIDKFSSLAGVSYQPLDFANPHGLAGSQDYLASLYSSHPVSPQSDSDPLSIARSVD